MRGASLISPIAIPNFRDAGGQATADGSRVRTGLLYRSTVLSDVDDADLGVLGRLGIRTVFDLRTAMERRRKPDRLPPGAELVELDVLADSGEADPAALFALMQDPPRASAELAGGETERFYLATYRDFINLPSARAAWAQLYRTISRSDGRPAVVHCTTGKDRTGWVVAALLLFLGVSTDEVMRDYLKSDAQVRQAYRPVVDDFVTRGGSREVIEPLMSVQPSYLDAALRAMYKRYGSVGTYFSDGLSIDVETGTSLRSAFLERP